MKKIFIALMLLATILSNVTHYHYHYAGTKMNKHDTIFQRCRVTSECKDNQYCNQNFWYSHCINN